MEWVARKEAGFVRPKEIADPTGFINTDGVSLNDSLGEKVTLVDFWAYGSSFRSDSDLSSRRGTSFWTMAQTISGSTSA